MSAFLPTRKPGLIHAILILVLTLAVAGIARPVEASPPETIDFDFDVTYYSLPTSVGTGSWSSNGLFSSGGDIVENANHVGSGPGICFRTVHSVDTLEDQHGTITLRMQMTQNQGGGCSTVEMMVNWVILSGTGAYADLRGQGQGTATGHVQVVAPGTLNYVLSYDLQGQGHFH